jgi:hypothetical protein
MSLAGLQPLDGRWKEWTCTTSSASPSSDIKLKKTAYKKNFIVLELVVRKRGSYTASPYASQNELARSDVPHPISSG